MSVELISRTGLAAGIVALCLSLTACAATEPSGTSDSASPAEEQVDETTPQDEPTEAKKPKKKKRELTSGQENALEAARSYIDMSGFSKQGLIEQLSSSAADGFSKADAKFAANHVGADWKQEAVEAAQSYLDMGGFSKQGLIEQLSSSAADNFTPAQARYAADKVY
ncbi:Ltp family lipoprotein [Solirubrobacter phytolaccae]|uniref:Ltp family lipoprotein n=1 Tax=Solirubrobacter phytolaccae TaxID=1404360 RepID=A0A9X3N3G7_9ACTN|nr:Ltp family lipoprotein [Solirubrobacter phytolaccae]MDA0178771.1 Ltp family lipoprotein [Solirubrobacter phytolaccae]